MTAGIVTLVVLVLAGLSLIPFGPSRRSIADRVSPRSAANTKNSRLG
jgi:hypothetical protein